MKGFVRGMLLVGSLAGGLPSVSVAQKGDPVLTVRTVGGQTTFRIGERIPLELSFTATELKRYEMTNAGYDRNGRMNYESFSVSPSSGWVDPLEAYFSNGSFMGGGLFNEVALGPQPVVIPLNLNEWVRFDQPGTYRVTVNSSRVNDTTKGRLFSGKGGVPVTSNTLELEIVEATPEWKEQRLKEILQAKDSPPRSEAEQKRQREASSDLRFLGTDSAILQMAAGLRVEGHDCFDCAFGLMGLPGSKRDYALQAMSRQMADPQFAISSLFLTTLAVLRSGDSSEPEVRQRYQEESWRSALAALPHKEGKARALTVEMLESYRPPAITPEMKAQMDAVMSSSLAGLPDERQALQLDWNWDGIRAGVGVAELERIATLPSEVSEDKSVFYGGRSELKAVALRRWYKIDPDAAMRAAMAEVGSARPSLKASQLYFLPKQSMPQLETVWADGLAKGDTDSTVLLGLMVRFGVGAAVAQVEGLLDKALEKPDCTWEAAALGYVVKFDPDRAGPLLDRALDVRGPENSGCRRWVLQEIGPYAHGLVVTKAAVKALSDPDHRVAINALLYLDSYGGKEAQNPVWERYVQWSDAWSGKQEELDARSRSSVEDSWVEEGLGQDLAQTLVQGQGWVADKELISRVSARCVGEQICALVKQAAAASLMPVRVSVSETEGKMSGTVAQYGPQSLDLLVEKAAQFPDGTKFVLVPGLPQNTDQKALEDEVKAQFRAKGLKLEVEQTRADK